MADVGTATPFDEASFQRWVVTSPWFDDLAKARGLTTDAMKAALAGQVFNDPEYDFRGMFTHNLSPTINGDNIVLPRNGPDGGSFLSPDAQIGDFFNTRFGVPAAFFGADTTSALQNATALGLLPGYSVPDIGGASTDSPDASNKYADSLSSYAADNPISVDGTTPTSGTPGLSVDLSGIVSADSIKQGAGSLAGGLLGGLAGPIGSVIGSGFGAYGAGASAGKAIGSAIGGGIGALGGPLGSLAGSFLGGLVGDQFGGGGGGIQDNIKATTTGTYSGGGEGLDADGNAISGSNGGTLGPNGIVDGWSSFGGGSNGSGGGMPNGGDAFSGGDTVSSPNNPGSEDSAGNNM